MQITLDDEFSHRTKLLQQSKMDSVHFFVKSYQQEALSSVIASAERLRGYFIVTDSSGDILLGNETDIDVHFFQSLPENLKGEDRLETTISFGKLHAEGISYLFAVTYFQPWDWFVFYVISDEYATSQIGSIFRQTLGAITFVLLLTIITVMFVLKHFIFSRIDILKNAAKQISVNKRVGNIPIHEHDDFGELARSMEMMAAKLLKNEERQKKLLKEAEELNGHLHAANSELTLLHGDMDRQVQARTAALEKVQKDLYRNLEDIKAQLDHTKEKNNKLVRKLSELTMKQSDMVNRHSDIVRNLRQKHESKILDRTKIENFNR